MNPQIIPEHIQEYFEVLQEGANAFPTSLNHIFKLFETMGERSKEYPIIHNLQVLPRTLIEEIRAKLQSPEAIEEFEKYGTKFNFWWVGPERTVRERRKDEGPEYIEEHEQAFGAMGHVDVPYIKGFDHVVVTPYALEDGQEEIHPEIVKAAKEAGIVFVPMPKNVLRGHSDLDHNYVRPGIQGEPLDFNIFAKQFAPREEYDKFRDEAKVAYSVCIGNIVAQLSQRVPSEKKEELLSIGRSIAKRNISEFFAEVKNIYFAKDAQVLLERKLRKFSSEITETFLQKGVQSILNGNFETLAKKIKISSRILDDAKIVAQENYKKFFKETTETYSLAMAQAYAEEIRKNPDQIFCLDNQNRYNYLVLKKLREEPEFKDVQDKFVSHYFNHLDQSDAVDPRTGELVCSSIPMAKEYVEGILAHDFITFHTPQFWVNFAKTAKDILGDAIDIDEDKKIIHYQERAIYGGSYCLGIDVDQWRENAQQKEATQYALELLKIANGRQIALTLNQADPLKDVPNQIRAFNEMLEKSENPENYCFFVGCYLANDSEVNQKALAETKKAMEETNQYWENKGLKAPIVHLTNTFKKEEIQQYSWGDPRVGKLNTAAMMAGAYLAAGASGGFYINGSKREGFGMGPLEYMATIAKAFIETPEIGKNLLKEAEKLRIEINSERAGVGGLVVTEVAGVHPHIQESVFTYDPAPIGASKADVKSHWERNADAMESAFELGCLPKKALKRFMKSWSRIRDLATKAWTYGTIGDLYALAELQRSNLKEATDIPPKSRFRRGFISGSDISNKRFDEGRGEDRQVKPDRF